MNEIMFDRTFLSPAACELEALRLQIEAAATESRILRFQIDTERKELASAKAQCAQERAAANQHLADRYDAETRERSLHDANLQMSADLEKANEQITEWQNLANTAESARCEVVRELEALRRANRNNSLDAIEIISNDRDDWKRIAQTAESARREAVREAQELRDAIRSELNAAADECAKLREQLVNRDNKPANSAVVTWAGLVELYEDCGCVSGRAWEFLTAKARGER